MESVVITVVAAVATGGVVGVIAGMLGVGGGSVLVPVFRLMFGMSPVMSTATSLFTIIPTSISGTVSHIRGKTCVPKIGVALGLGGAIISPLGVQAANYAPGWLVMAVVACIIVYMSTSMFRKGLAMPKTPIRKQGGAKTDSGESGANGTASDQGGQKLSEEADGHNQLVAVQLAQSADAQAAQPAHFEVGRRQVGLAVVVGAVAGFASGFSGLGGGFIMIPLMLSVLHMPMKLTSGTSLIAIMILATPATVAQLMLGNVDLIVGIAVACGTIPAAYFGAKLVKRLPERTLRLVFACFLVVGAALLVLKEVSLVV